MVDPQRLADRTQLVGGKAAHLEWLLLHTDELGYKVPDYDVVDTSVFDSILESVGIRRKIEVIRGFASKILSGEYDSEEIIHIAEAEHLDPFNRFRENLNRIRANSDYISEDFLSDAIHGLSLSWSWILSLELRTQLMGIHAPFDKQKYVMRSSATCEDGKNDSFAGLFTTKGPVVLTDRSIYNTLFGVDVLIDYSFDEFIQNIGSIYGDFLRKREVTLQDRIKLEDKMAIIIQKFVHTNPSGVIYTRLPEEPNILTLETVADTCNWVVNGDGTYIMDFNRSTGGIDEIVATEGISNPLSEEQTQMVYRVAVALDER